MQQPYGHAQSCHVPLQEKAQETEKYMSDLTAEMDKVRLEKSKLEERNQLLETVLSLSKQDRPLPTKGILQLVRPETSPQCRTAFLLSPSVSESRFPV